MFSKSFVVIFASTYLFCCLVYNFVRGHLAHFIAYWNFQPHWEDFTCKWYVPFPCFYVSVLHKANIPGVIAHSKDTAAVPRS